MTTNKNNWTKSSWKNFPALQQPSWTEQEGVENVLANLSRLPPLVFAGEIRSLKQLLAKAVTGDAFLLQNKAQITVGSGFLPALPGDEGLEREKGQDSVRHDDEG